MSDLVPSGTPINMDGVERRVVFTLPAIYEIQKKLDKPINDVIEELISGEDIYEKMVLCRDVLTILFNDEARRKKNAELEVDEKTLEDRINSKNIWSVSLLLLKEYGLDIPELDDEDPNVKAG